MIFVASNGLEDKEPKGKRNKSHPIFLIALQGSVQKVSGHLLILIQPLDDKRFEPPAEEHHNLKLYYPSYHGHSDILRVHDSDNMRVRWESSGVTHVGYSGTRLLKKGRSLQYSL